MHDGRRNMVLNVLNLPMYCSRAQDSASAATAVELKFYGRWIWLAILLTGNKDELNQKHYEKVILNTVCKSCNGGL